MPDDVLERLFGELAGADLPVPPPARVVARGRQRRRRARGRVLAGAAAGVALLGLVVSELAGSHSPAQSPTVRHNKATVVCPAVPDPALTAELQRALPTADQTGIAVITLSPDGSAAYALTTAHGVHGIAEESVATGAITRMIVTSLPPHSYGAQGGLGPHGELVYTLIMSVDSGSEMSAVLLWSPETGSQSPLEPAGQHGAALSAPVFGGPSNQFVAWVQADGSLREIVEADLVTRTVDVIATGYVGPPIFVGNTLVWSVADAPGQQETRLVARDAAVFPAQQQTSAPAALRGVSPWILGGGWGPASAPGQPAVTLAASYGGATAYFSAGLTELYYSPEPSQPARLVLRLPQGGDTFGAGPPVLGPGYLGWTTAGAASYVASTASLAAVRLTDGRTTSGAVLAAGRFVVSASSPDPKQGSWRLSILSGATINGLACAPARSPGR